MTTKIKVALKTAAGDSTETPDDLVSNLSYLGQTIEETYQSKELRDHIYSDPDTYSGSIDPQEEEVWYYDTESERMVKEKVTFIECFYKIFDEIIVNAVDHHFRIESKRAQGMTDLKAVRNIRIVINQEEGWISVENDGEGLDVAMHDKFNMYVPQMIFSELLTGSNYDKTKEQTVGGKNGYGAKITNIFSNKFSIETVDSHRKLLYCQTWTDNMKTCQPPSVQKYTKVPYTKVTYYPDYRRFKISPEQISSIGDWKLLHRRAYDAAACTGTNVSVYLNEKKINVKSFEDYINLYIGSKSETRRVYMEVNDRWQLAVCLSPDGEFEQVSFVNGIFTDRGGSHVRHVMDNLARRITETISTASKKKEVDIKPDFIKKNLFIFLRSTIVNPKFDTQTKRKLVSLVKDFGSRCDLTDDFVSKVIKLGILERAKKLAEFKARESLGKKTDGKPRARRVFHPKLVDANEAGGPLSNKCTIVFTEGDSAATFMAAGLKGIPEDQHRLWGWYSLRGKLLNVRGATIKQLESNEEIMMMKKIIGLEEKRDYSKSIDGLRYHRIIILTDADDDGYHIKGLVMNFIGHYWPSLLKRKGFICDFATPINKAFKTDSRGARLSEVEFYSQADYREWQTTHTKGWDCQYYKGLGSYEPKEARDLCKNMRITQYIWNSDPNDSKSDIESSAAKFDLAFDKDKADARKEWLNDGTVPQPIVPITGEVTMVTYDNFIDNRLKLYSAVANVRAIPNLYDGLKPGQRKVLYSAFKRGLKERIKVIQLSGYVSEHAAYHYGDSSLVGTIVHMAQDYVGVNNINYLYPSGGFGSRLGGGPKFKKGEDAAAPRYTNTFMCPITRSIFHADDMALLDYIIEEGQSIEPQCYMPTVPMVLINGARGIGTGYSTEIAQYNPKEVVANVKACMRGVPMSDMIPWFKGYLGDVVPDVSKTGVYITVGKYMRLGPDKIRILELPVGVKNCKSYKAYIAFLSTLLDDEVAKQHGIKREKKRRTVAKSDADGDAEDDEDSDSESDSGTLGDVVHDYEVVSKSNTDYIIDIIFKEGVLEKELANNDNYRFEKKLKLAFTITCSNMHLYVDDGTIKKFSSPQDIITEYCRVRIGYYTRRRERLLRKYELDIGKANARYRFVTDIMDEVIDIRRKTRAVVEQMLEGQSPPYPKFTNNVDDDADKEGYKYLLGMEISSFTSETLDRLRREVGDAQALLDRLSGQTEADMWDEDLDVFLKEYDLDVEDWYRRNEMKMPPPPRKKLGCELRQIKITMKTN